MYNEKFISDYPEKLYLDYLDDINKLKELYANYVNRYNPDKKIDGSLNLFKESLDHYVVKRLEADPNFKTTIQFKNYITYIRHVSNFGFDVLTNPFFNCIEDYELIKYLGDSKMQKVKIMRAEKEQTIKNIMLKISNNKKVTQKELNTVCEYYSGIRKYTFEYDELITYIFSKLPISTELICSYQVLDAILAYLPFEYFKEDGFIPEDIRLCATDINNKKIMDGPGCSKRNCRQVLINRNMFYNVNFKSIDDAKKGTYLKKGTDFTFLMIVAYHEITHQLQEYKSKKKCFSDQGLMHATSSILRKELSDYKRNHDNDEIEIDATQVGWKVCQLFYAKHFISSKKEELCSQCYKNSNATQTRRSIAAKLDSSGNIINKSEYDVEKLSKIIKGNPDYLKEFSVLSNLYDSKGNLNINILFKRNLWHSVIGNDYIEYILSSGLWKNIVPYIETAPNDKILCLLENIYNVIRNSLTKIDRINYNLRLNLSGEYAKNKSIEDAKNELMESFFENYNIFKEISQIVLSKNKDINIINSLKTYVSLLCRKFHTSTTGKEQQLFEEYIKSKK